ncbi:MAG: GH92 family glycosyl hydrolase [Bacteroidales bacterium]|nr:GH92 family glycosyl hydrolase [Bacteroidales bacterium]
MGGVFMMSFLAAAMVAVATSLTSYVQPFVGTTNFGACNPGAVVPSGMMSVSPFNVMGSELNVWDKDSRWWSTPYVYENKYFTGFSHVNLSGVGCPDVGALLTMPTTGPLQVDYHAYGSEYANEAPEPGYYGLDLTAYGVKAEATTTLRSSVERYTFPAGQANILLNLGEGLTNESGAYVRRVSDTEIEGMRFAGTFCYNSQAVFPVYFVMRVNKAPSAQGFWKKQRPMTAEAAWDSDAGKYKIYTKYGRELAGDQIGYWYTFADVADGEQVQVQMGISFVSCANARANLDAEQPAGFNFDAVRKAAAEKWEADLGRIRVQGGTLQQKQVFYTALYHALIHPSVVSDVNGDYPLMEGSGTGRVEAGHERYSIFSLWDTYRNVHQLLTLVYPERQADMLRSMVDMYKEWGWMPKWELFGRETFTMEGDPAICVITDSYLKGLRDFDIDAAYQAFKKSAETPGAQNLMRPDADPYNSLGYIPVGWFAGDFSGDNSVSHALEYYVADNALSLLAAELGKTDDANLYRQRSLGYKNYYDKESGALRPIGKDGKFITPFNPEDGADFSNAVGFHEGSAWNYTFYVPHDVLGYARLMGGPKAFVNKLQMVFDKGLFDPANEPDIAYPYLFSYFPGQEWRTAKTVDALLEKYFTTAPDGIPGNDDTGTMSAWAVFSMMGFYPDCPGVSKYTFTTPTFDKIEIAGKLTITKTPGRRITAIRAGGRKVGYRIDHDALVGAGTIEFKCK